MNPLQDIVRLIAHAKETHPHFESERGKADIQYAEVAVAILAAKQAPLTEREETNRGATIRRTLQLKQSIEPGWDEPRVTTRFWGSKTDLGLFRTMKRIVETGGDE